MKNNSLSIKALIVVLFFAVLFSMNVGAEQSMLGGTNSQLPSQTKELMKLLKKGQSATSTLSEDKKDAKTLTSNTCNCLVRIDYGCEGCGDSSGCGYKTINRIDCGKVAYGCCD
ncbi:MAG: hypothetical protein WC856_27945 [Methylococcaceae bacterium]|jgi:hypothetical protein